MFYLTLQATYTSIEYALCNHEQTLLTASDDKIHASKNIITIIQRLLDDQKLTLADLQFIAVNQGPAPFTTLRTVIATVNGIAFASNIPLIAINGLDAFVKEWQSDDYPYTIALLNAFGHDVYYGTNSNVIAIGYGNYQKVLTELQTKTDDKPVFFVGNGATMYRDAIQNIFGRNAHFPNPIPATVSITYLARCAIEQWQTKQQVVHQIEPLYLKIQY